MTMRSLLLPNILAVARREFTWRARSRTFVVTTLFILVAAVLIALAPVVIGYFDRNSSTKVGVHVAATDLQVNPVASLNALLNAPAAVGSQPAAGKPGKKPFTVSDVSDVTAGRLQIRDGKLNALLEVSRDAGGTLGFTLYTDDSPTGQTAQMLQQAATAIAVQDRLTKAGVQPSEQAGLFAPPVFQIQSPDPAKPAPKTPGITQDIANTLVGAGLAIFIFMAIILYGTWVAMSVVEEKNSRVMEVILNAASPLQLLAGKVIGVGGVAIAQYVLVAVPAVGALLLQGQISSFVLGETPEALSLPSGLTIPALLVFSVYFVLGFGLYAVLFAAAGSLVSRQEDVNAIVAPMTLLSSVGYFVSVYAATGLFDLEAPWVVALSHVPFLSPYLMMTRFVAGKTAAWEVPVSIAVLCITIVGAVWVAARIYSAGVLMYGQRPGLRMMVNAARTAR
jgi:ABC-2 type transport system permease protein